MKNRKTRNVIIGLLCLMLVFMGLGYAILSQRLTINAIGNVKGKWDVHISNIELVKNTGLAIDKSHSYTDLSAQFEAELYAPGDSLEYKITVTNAGNIDAMLDKVILEEENNTDSIKISNTAEEGQFLEAGTSMDFTIKIEFSDTATNIPEGDKITYNLELIYNQNDGKSIVRTAELKVGDYVRYKSTKSDEYQGTDSSIAYYALGEENGFGYASGIARDIDSGDWRVLRIDGSNVTLISSSASNPSARESTGEDSYGRLLLKGEQLYNNGVEILNRQCDYLYTTEFGKARSVNIEDINELVGYTPATPTKYKITNLNNAYFPNRYRDDYGSAIDSDTLNTSGFMPSVAGINTESNNVTSGDYSGVSRYFYTGASQATTSLTVHDNSYKYAVTEEANGTTVMDLVYGDDRTSTNGAGSYWIATRAIHFNGSQAWFTMFYFNPTATEAVTYDGYPYSSDNYGITTSSTKANQRAHFLRPVVELKSNVKINTKLIDQDEDGTIQDGSKSQPWTISW